MEAPKDSQEFNKNIQDPSSESHESRNISSAQYEMLLKRLLYLCQQAVNQTINVLKKQWNLSNSDIGQTEESDPNYDKKLYLRFLQELNKEVQPEAIQQTIYFQQLLNWLFEAKKPESPNKYLQEFTSQTNQLKQNLIQLTKWLITYLSISSPVQQSSSNQQQNVQDVQKFEKILSILTEALNLPSFQKNNQHNYYVTSLIKKTKDEPWIKQKITKWMHIKRNVQNGGKLLEKFVRDRLRMLGMFDDYEGELEEAEQAEKQYKREKEQQQSVNSQQIQSNNSENQRDESSQRQGYNNYAQNQESDSKNSFQVQSQQQLYKYWGVPEKSKENPKKHEKIQKQKFSGPISSVSIDYRDIFGIPNPKIEVKHRWHGPQILPSPASSFQLQPRSSSEERQKFYGYPNEQCKQIQEDRNQDYNDHDISRNKVTNQQKINPFQRVSIIGMLQNHEEKIKGLLQFRKYHMSSQQKVQSKQKKEKTKKKQEQKQKKKPSKGGNQRKLQRQGQPQIKEPKPKDKKIIKQKPFLNQKWKEQNYLKKSFILFNYLLSKQDFDWTDQINSIEVSKTLYSMMRLFMKDFQNKVVMFSKLRNRKYEGQNFGDQFRFFSSKNKQLPKIMLKDQQLLPNLKLFKNNQQAQIREKLMHIPSIEKLIYPNKLQSHFQLRNRELKQQNQLAKTIKYLTQNLKSKKLVSTFENYLQQDEEKQPIQQIFERQKQERSTQRLYISVFMIASILNNEEYRHFFANEKKFYKLQIQS